MQLVHIQALMHASACRERGMELNMNKSKTVHIAKRLQRRLTIVFGGGR